VVDDDTQEPIARVNLLFRHDEGTEGTSTDADGRFQIELRPGEYVAEISVLGYQSARRTVTVREGQSTSIRVALSPREYALNEVVVSDEQQRPEQGPAEPLDEQFRAGPGSELSIRGVGVGVDVGAHLGVSRYVGS